MALMKLEKKVIVKDLYTKIKVEGSISKSVFISLVSVQDFQATVKNFPSDVFINENIFLLKMEEAELKTMFFPINSHVYSYTERSDRNMEIDIKEHYNIGKYENYNTWHPQIVTHIGKWRNFELDLTKIPLLERRQDLKGLVIKAETMPESPWMVSLKHNRVDGILGDVWHRIVEKTLNITTQISHPPDYQWGSINENGSWNGMVGGLLENRTDIILASMAKTAARGKVIQFSTTFDEMITGVFIKRPKREASWTTFLEPFNTQVWITWLFLLFTIVVAFCCTFKLGPENCFTQGELNSYQAPLIVLSSSLAQGSFLEPKSTSAKILFIFSFFLGVIILISFNATLTSYLAVFKLTFPFNDLAEILHTEYTFGGLGNAIYDDIFQAPKGSEKRSIGDKLVEQSRNVILNTYDEAHALILKEKFAYVTAVEEMNVRNKDNCHFVQIPFQVQSFQIALGFPKNFPLAPLINRLKERKHNFI